MRATRRFYTILLLLIAATANAKTFTAISSGNWVLPKTWSCNCVPAKGDNVIIPQGIIVSITRPVTALAIRISIAGELEFNNGMLQIGDTDKITVLPGGRIVAKGLGGVIYVDRTPHYLEYGKVIAGPATVSHKVFPIALMFFAADSNEGHVTLNWASAGEIDVKQYEILSSRDSVTFQTIGTVNGSKHSLRRKDYNFPIGDGNEGEFYRLEAVKADSARVVLSTILAK